MSQTQQPERQQLSKAEFHQRTLRNTAIATAVACPLLVLLPPRKLDFFTAGLCITTLFSTNYLVADYTGRTITQHITGARPAPVLSSGVGAQQTEDAQTRVSDAVLQRHLRASRSRRLSPTSRWNLMSVSGSINL